MSSRLSTDVTSAWELPEIEVENIPPKKTEHPDNFWGAEGVHPQYLGVPGLVPALLPFTPGKQAQRSDLAQEL